MDDSKLLTLHHSGSGKHAVRFFTKSSREEFLAGIRELIGAPPDAPLRFRDADGAIVIVSPGMPGGLELHVAVEGGAAFTGALAPALPPASAVEWRRWARTCNPSDTISADGLTFAVSSATGFSAYTPLLPTTGVHYFAIQLSDRPCCVCMGPVDASAATVHHAHHAHSKEHRGLLAIKGFGRGALHANDGYTSGRPAMTVGVYFDADARFMVFVRHKAPALERTAVRIDRVPVPAQFVLVGPKHSLTATIVRAPMPPVVARGEGQRYNKVKVLKRKNRGSGGGDTSDSSDSSDSEEEEEEEEEEEGGGGGVERDTMSDCDDTDVGDSESESDSDAEGEGDAAGPAATAASGPAAAAPAAATAAAAAPPAATGTAPAVAAGAAGAATDGSDDGSAGSGAAAAKKRKAEAPKHRSKKDARK